MLPMRCSGCHVSMICPSRGASRYVQKKGAVSRAILGAFTNMFSTHWVALGSCRERCVLSGYRNVLTRWR